jgi:hypothetical protein
MSAELASAYHKVVALNRSDLDISDAGRVASAMDRLPVSPAVSDTLIRGTWFSGVYDLRGSE